MTEAQPKKYSAEEWDHIRKRFYSSILNETEIAKLGQNVGISWPFKGSDETAAKYIEYTFEELKNVPGLVGKLKRVHTLMDILREILAFDDPFSEMADTVEAESEEDDTFERILAKLNIPVGYPAPFVHFSSETKELLMSQELETLLDIIHFGQKLAQNVVMGGDLKSFLNGLAHKDEACMAKHVPYRRGAERGLHLPEAMGLLAADLDAATQCALIRQSGAELTEAETRTLQSANPQKVEAALKSAMEQVDALCQWFTAEASELEAMYRGSESAERYFIMVNDPLRERVALALTGLKYGKRGPDSGGGFFGKISGIFGR